MQLTKINGKYELWLPDHRAARPEWKLENGGWEVARIEVMREWAWIFHTATHRNPIVFDVGVEEGDITAILSKYGKCDIVMFEPNSRVWPCIKAIWKENKLSKPLHFFGGFISDKTTAMFDEQWVKHNLDYIHGEMIHDHGFKQLYENYPDVPQITLDDYVAATGLIPDMLTIDIEGAEWSLIKGAEQTLCKHKPTIFMSIHPEFLYESYRNEGIWKEKYGERCFVVHMLRFINELGYKHSIIEWDWHECHARFDPI